MRMERMVRSMSGWTRTLAKLMVKLTVELMVKLAQTPHRGWYFGTIRQQVTSPSRIGQTMRMAKIVRSMSGWTRTLAEESKHDVTMYLPSNGFRNK